MWKIHDGLRGRPASKRVTKPHTLKDRDATPPLPFGSPSRGTVGPIHKPSLRYSNDARTGMPSGIPEGAMCVQRFDDSRNSAIHITYRISLRSSSMPEPRDPLLKVLMIQSLTQTSNSHRVPELSGGHGPGGDPPGDRAGPRGPAEATGT